MSKETKTVERELRRGDDVDILVNHHGRIKPEFFNKRGVIAGIHKKEHYPYDVLVVGVGMASFKDTELRRVEKKLSKL